MFKLYEPMYRANLEEWGSMSRTLQIEKENQKMILSNMGQDWSGETQCGYENICRELITTGLYEQMAEIASKKYQLQFDLHPQIIAQMSRCEKLEEQLLHDDYFQPYLSGNGYYNDGQLMLDESYISGYNCAAEEAIYQATMARNLLCAVMNTCGGIIDFTEERQLVEASYRKIKRIENFVLECNKYVAGVREIECELKRGMSNIMASDSDPTNYKWKEILQDLGSKGKHAYVMLRLWLMRGTTTLTSFLNEINTFELSPELEDLLIMNDDKVYVFEELLQKDVSEITDAERAKLKSFYGEICASIENAEYGDPCIVQQELLERFLTNLYEADIKYEYGRNGGTFVGEGRVLSKDELILSLMDVQGEEQPPSLANNILNSILGTNAEIAKKWYAMLSGPGMLSEIESQDLVNINVRVTEVGCTLSTVFCPHASKREKYKDEGVQEYYIVGEDKINNYIESLSPSEYAHLTKMGYDKQQISAMLGLVGNTSDLQLSKYLMAGKEESVFAMDPDGFSEGGKSILAAYAINMGIQDINSGNSLQNTERFTNYMLSAENWKEKEYMEILSVFCGLQREAVATAMWESEGIEISLVEKMEKVDALTGFYQSLYIIGYDMQLEYAMLTKNKLHISVKNFVLEDDKIKYTITDDNPDATGDLYKNVISEINWQPLEANADLFSNEMIEINEQICTLWKESSMDTVISLVGLIDQNSAKMLEMSKAMYLNDYKSGLSAGAELKINETELSKDINCFANILGIWGDYYEEKKQLMENYEQAGENSKASWFYSSNTYCTNDKNDTMYHMGIYNGYVIEAIKAWNKEGIASFCKRQDIDRVLYELRCELFSFDNNVLQIKKSGWEHKKNLDLYTDEEVLNAMILILYGEKGVTADGINYKSCNNNVVEIDPYLFSTCISEINDRIAIGQEGKSLQDWW